MGHTPAPVADRRWTSRVFSVGTMLAAACLLAGIAMRLSGASDVGGDPLDPAALAEAVIGLRPWGWSMLGVIILLLTPPTGLLATFVELRRAGQASAWLALVVLAVLATAVLIALDAAVTQPGVEGPSAQLALELPSGTSVEVTSRPADTIGAEDALREARRHWDWPDDAFLDIHFVNYTNDHQRHDDGALLFDEVPVWLITIGNIEFSGYTPRSDVAPTTYRNIGIIIDAHSGELVTLFATP